MLQVNDLLPSSRIFEQSRGSLPIRTAFANHSFANGLTDRTAERVQRVISRQDLEGAVLSGRSYCLSLAENERLHLGERIFRTLKLKMVTDRGGPPSTGTYKKPADITTRPPRYLVDLDREDKIRFTPYREHPTGTGFLYEAKNEYIGMIGALNSGIRTGYPIGLGQFLDMEYDGLPLGYIIIALEQEEDIRIGDVLAPMVANATGLDFLVPFYRSLSGYATICANTLGRLNRAGITHNFPHMRNFGVGADEKEAFLYDFAYSSDMRSLGRDGFAFKMFCDFRHLYVSTYLYACNNQVGPLTLQEYMDASAIPSPFRRPFEGVMDHGYFCKQDIERMGRPRLIRALRLSEFLPFVSDALNPRSSEGVRFRDLDHDSVRIFRELANTVYNNSR